MAGFVVEERGVEQLTDEPGERDAATVGFRFRLAVLWGDASSRALPISGRQGQVVT